MVHRRFSSAVPNSFLRKTHPASAGWVFRGFLPPAEPAARRKAPSLTQAGDRLPCGRRSPRSPFLAEDSLLLTLGGHAAQVHVLYLGACRGGGRRPQAEVLLHRGGVPAEHGLHHPDVAVHVHGVHLVELVQLVLKARHDGVHGPLDALLGLAQVGPLHPGGLKLCVGIQQLLGGGEVVVEEGIDAAPLPGIGLHRLEDLGRDLLQPVDLGGKHGVRDAVVGPADVPQDAGVALLRLLGRDGRLLGLLLAALPVLIRLAGAEEVPQLPVEIGLAPEVALGDHGLQVLGHPPLGEARDPRQLLHGHGGPVPHHGEILGVALQAPVHAQAAAQHGPAAHHHGKGGQQILHVVAGDLLQPEHHLHRLGAGHKTHRRQDGAHDHQRPGGGFLLGGRLHHLVDGLLGPVGLAGLPPHPLACPLAGGLLQRRRRRLLLFLAAAHAEELQEQQHQRQGREPEDEKQHDESPGDPALVLLPFRAHWPSPFLRSFRLLPCSSTM